jgi:hypothetical protein
MPFLPIAGVWACGVAPLVDKETMVDSSCELLWILKAGPFTLASCLAAL